MENSTPPNIILHESKEVIFYISNNYKTPINIDLWKKELNLLDYKGLVIHSKCIFNRLKNDDSLSKNQNNKSSASLQIKYEYRFVHSLGS